MLFSTSRYLLVSLLVFSTIFGARAQNNKAQDGVPQVFKSALKRQHFQPNSTHQSIKLTGLKPAETYQLSISPDATNGCIPIISSTGLATSTGGSAVMTFVAAGDVAEFMVVFPCSWSTSEVPTFTLSILCTSCSLITKLLNTPDEVLTVQEEDAETAVKDILIGGNCFDVTGVSLCGGGGALGSFANGLTSIGFNRGLIIATGPIGIAPGPNTSDGAGGSAGSCGPDGDLAALSSGSQFDVAKLEFDFTPTQPVVVFDYVFASEEYCEYVGSQFNDVFGFFISGPGIPGGTQNLALAGGVIPVTINNINHLSNTGFFVNNQPSSSGNLCGQTASSAAATNELQYDGYTRRFTAISNVIPCQTYHIKLAISDIGDGAFDSAVFLKDGSFDAGGNASVEWLVNNEPGSETYEKCGQVSLLFDRVGGNIGVPMNVSFTVTGTATSGLDYTPIPTSITIPAGQDQFILPVNILADLLVEGQESIRITLTNLCSCLMPTEILYINDLPILKTQPDTVVICGGGVAVVDATYEGGVAPYSFLWSNSGGTAQQAAFFVSVSGNYKVTITDDCGQTVVQTIRVKVNPPPKAQLLPPAPQLCANGGNGVLNINFIGNGPFELVYSLNGNPQDPITDITTNPYQLQVSEIGMYQIISVTDFEGCQGTGAGAQLVIQSQLNLTGVPSNVQCFGQTNGSINTTVTGGGGPYNYVWTGPQIIPNIPDPLNLQAGTYTVTVTDGFTCTVTNTFNILAANVISPTATQAQAPNCYNPTGGSINLVVNGGFPAYNYKWSNTSTVQNPQNLPPGTYTVTITDQSGCTRTTSVSIVGDQTPPIAAGVAEDEIDCQTLSVILNGQGSSVGANFNYIWTPVGAGVISGSNNTLTTTVTQGGTYRLKVTNATNGCTSIVDVPVTSNVLLPVAEAGPPQILTCAITNVTLDGSGSSSSANNFTYTWTPSNGGVISGGANTLSPIVSATGTYTLVVRNNLNFCTSSDNVAVTANLAPPNAAIAPAGQINCAQTQVTLNALPSTPSNVYYDWSTINGNIISGNTSANPVVSEAGDYRVVVTNPSNGCTDDASVNVSVNQSAPVVNTVLNGELNCLVNQLVITGLNPTNDGTPTWVVTQGGNIVSGGNTLTPTINKPGLYTLTVTNPINKCSASASVLVNQNILPPLAVAGVPATINCYNNTVTIGDPATLFIPGTNYQWTSTGGGAIQGPSNQPSATATNAGTYSLLVTNSLNGCTNAASVSIAQDKTPPVATIAPTATINCNQSFVQINAGGSSTGPAYNYSWSSPTGSISAGVNTLNPVVTSAGNYQLVVTNNVNGCTSTANATVSSNLDIPLFDIQAAPPITCLLTQQILSATVLSAGNFGYQWGSIDGIILSGANTLTPVINAPGTYTLIVTNSTNNCSAVENVVVPANNTAPQVSAGINQTLSCTTPTLLLNGTAPTTGHSYLWTSSGGGNLLSGINSLTPTINKAGNYTLLVTNLSNGCTSTSTVVVNADAGIPIIQVQNPAILNCTTQQIVLNATGSSTGSDFLYDWNGQGIVTGNNTLTPTINQPGTYTLVITNTANGCVNTSSVTVPSDVSPPVADAGPVQTLNCYQAQYQIGGANISTGSNFIYNWAGPGILSGATNAQPIINQPGQYNVTVSNTINGCSTTGSVSINADFATPAVNAGPDGLITCTDNFFETVPVVTGSGTLTYLWTTTGGSFLTVPTQLAPLLNGAGFYYLTVTNTITGCTATDQMQVYESADFPEADAGSPDILTCGVQQLTLDGASSSQNGPYIYTWLPLVGGNIVSGGNTLYPIIDAPGTYSLAVRDTSNSCISYSTVVIGENVAAPEAEAGNSVTLTCSVNSLTLQGDVNSNGTFSYLWTASNGGNILSGSTSLNPIVNAVGTYTIEVTNTNNGCTGIDQVTILADQNAPVVAIATPDTLNCNFQSITLDATGSTVGNVQYNWVTTNGNIIDQSDSSKIKVNAPGLYQLIIQNLDNNCASLTAINVAQDIVSPLAKAGADDLLNCTKIIATLDGTGSSVNGNYFYQWTTPNGEILADPNSLTPTISAAGTYLLTVLNTDNGCKSSDVVNVDQDIKQPVIAIAIPALITCFSPEVVLDGSNSSAGSNFEYAWTTPNGNIVNGSDETQAVVNTIGTYTLTIINTANGCANASTTVVEENTVSPSVQILPPGTITCSDPIVNIIALAENGSQYSFGWSTIDGNIVSGASTLKLNVDEPGSYSILIVNTSTGCAALANTDVIEVTERPDGFVFTLTPPGCKDNDGYVRFDSVSGGIEPYLYSVNGGASFSTSIAFSSLIPGPYELIIQDANGCEYSEDLDIPKAIDPAIDIVPQFSLQLGDSLQLNAVLPPGFPLNVIDTITWDPLTFLEFKSSSIADLLTPICKPFNTMQYTVSILTKNGGCRATDRVLVQVNTEPKIYIPNVFYPDDPTQTNHLFYIFAEDTRKQVKQINSFQIFDRWGEMVHQAFNFQPNDPSRGWDGKIGGIGKTLTPAVFVYYAEIEMVDGRKLLYQGDVTLVR